jgi:hypothetical protein
MFVGANVAGWTYGHYAPDRVRERLAQADSSETPFPYAPGSIAAVELLDWDTSQKSDFSLALQLKPDTALRLADEGTKVRLPEAFTVKDSNGEPQTFSREQLMTALEMADRVYGDKDGIVTRPEWRLAQRADWFYIWLWPAIAAGVTLVFFWFGFRDRIVGAGVATEQGTV